MFLTIFLASLLALLVTLLVALVIAAVLLVRVLASAQQHPMLSGFLPEQRSTPRKGK